VLPAINGNPAFETDADTAKGTTSNATRGASKYILSDGDQRRGDRSAFYNFDCDIVHNNCD
jgi:hypothetical protein